MDVKNFITPEIAGISRFNFLESLDPENFPRIFYVALSKITNLEYLYLPKKAIFTQLLASSLVYMGLSGTIEIST